MRDNIIIINYMRVNPTIVDDLVEYFHNNFKKIYIVNRNTTNNEGYKNILKYSNVRVYEVRRIDRVLLLPKTLFSIFKKCYLDNLSYGIIKNKFSIRDIMFIFKNIHIDNLLISVLKKISCIENEPENTILYSLWLTNEAFAAAHYKRKFNKLYTVSMAHAHEIESFDNKFIFWTKKFIHTYIDKIIFISQTKFSTYKKNILNEFCINDINCSVLYWGSKYFDFKIKRTSTNKKIIVSCSTVEDLKRVDLIAKSIKHLNEEVKWYHFGDGNKFSDLSNFVKSFSKEIRDNIHLLGRVENGDIKKFYYSNDVILFINVSTTEGLPISVMEAQSYGIPTLVTDVGGEREIVINEYNGYIVNKDINEIELARIITKHITKSSIEIEEMKMNARYWWSSHFNLDKNINNYLSILNE